MNSFFIIALFCAISFQGAVCSSSLFGNVPIGGACLSDDDCVVPERSMCVGILGFDYCVCKAGYVSSSDKLDCLVIKNEIGDNCTEPQQCQYGNLGNLTDCVQNACACSREAVLSYNGTRCLPIASDVGSDCEESIQCQAGAPGEYSECIIPDGEEIGSCFCTFEAVSPPGFNVCLKLVTELGEFCEINEQCAMDFSVCRDQKCDCLGGYIPGMNNTKCIPGVSLNDPCDSEEDCSHIPNAGCLPNNGTPPVNTCQCNVGHVAFENECFEIVNEVNKTCSHDFQCTSGLGQASLCDDGLCQCEQSYGYWDHGCHFPAGLGELCFSNGECIVGVNELAMCAHSGDGKDRCRCIPEAVEFQNSCRYPPLQ